ncbi:MAG: VCBS repeat-containing protein [Kiritimatiellae bacterium]|nr:VCBS repeat-containing protein [Kiritimatiellia bacterium]
MKAMHVAKWGIVGRAAAVTVIGFVVLLATEFGASPSIEEPRITDIQTIDGQIRISHDAVAPVDIWMKTPDQDWTRVATSVMSPTWSFVPPVTTAEFKLTITVPDSSPPLVAVMGGGAGGSADGGSADGGAAGDDPAEGGSEGEGDSDPGDAAAGAGGGEGAVAAAGNNHAMATPDPGRLKLFWHNQNSGIVYDWFLKEDGRLKSYGLAAQDTIAATWQLSGVGDIDRDGIDDFLWHNQQSGLVVYWLLEVDGYLRSSGLVSGDAISPTWQLSGVGDIDKDGTVDLLWHNQQSGLVVYWLLNSNATLKSQGLLTEDAISPTWQLSGVGDIDKDGTVDLLWHNQQSGLVVYWLLNSNATLKGQGLLSEDAISPTWQLSGVGDIDKDGTVDLLWHNQQSGLVVYWLLNSNASLKSQGLVTDDAISPTWQLSGIGDIDNDGTIDLLWHNQRSGLVVHWLLNSDASLKSSALVSADAISPTWRLSGVGF